jgi:hypothetical protein
MIRILQLICLILSAWMILRAQNLCKGGTWRDVPGIFCQAYSARHILSGEFCRAYLAGVDYAKWDWRVLPFHPLLTLGCNMHKNYLWNIVWAFVRCRNPCIKQSVWFNQENRIRTDWRRRQSLSYRRDISESYQLPSTRYSTILVSIPTILVLVLVCTFP